MIAQLLPYAQYSHTAAAEISALAQEAGVGTMNYQQLKEWVGNTNDAQKTLNSTINTATQAMSNLDQVAANLSSTLNSVVS